MNCKNIQNLLLTDYLDEQLEEEKKKSFDNHLSSCFKCRELASVAQNNIMQPFINAENFIPSDQIWQRIKKAIEEKPEPVRSGFLTSFWNSIKESFLFPRLAYALAGILVIFVVIMTLNSMTLERQQKTNQESEKEIEYITYLAEATLDVSVDQNGGYGTAIEYYFL